MLVSNHKLAEASYFPLDWLRETRLADLRMGGLLNLIGKTNQLSYRCWPIHTICVTCAEYVDLARRVIVRDYKEIDRPILRNFVTIRVKRDYGPFVKKTTKRTISVAIPSLPTVVDKATTGTRSR